MKKMNLVAIMLVIFAVFTAGCLGGDEETPPPKMVVGKSTETTAGFCGNPEWSGAEPSSVQYTYEANDTIVVAYILTLTWVDDHEGESSADIYDEFKLTATAGNTTMKDTSDTGELVLILGADNFSEETEGNDTGNATISEDALIKDYTPLGTCDITVECVAAGVYPGGVFGIVLGNYDEGNNWNLEIEAWILEPAAGAPM